MKNERETKQKLLICAKKEFLEKGYHLASLRIICKQAEVTTGALYFFFKDKADLFAALVDEPVNRLYEAILAHFKEELEMPASEFMEDMDISRDIQAALETLHYMYQYYDEFQLVLTRSQGSGYENCIDRFVDIAQKHYKRLADQLCRQWNRPLVDEYLIHWMAHMQMDAFVHMITHEKSEEAASRYMRQMVRYFASGFLGLLKP